MTVKTYYLKKGVTEYQLYGYELSKEGNQAIDTTNAYLSRSYDSSFDIGDDVSIGYHDGTDTYVPEIYGDVTNKETHEQLTLTIESYGGRLNRSENINAIYEDDAPETIVASIVNNYTTLTYAGTETTGVTIDRFVVLDENASEVIDRIIKSIGWQIRVDTSKNVYLEPKGTTLASEILTVGTNAFLEGNWKRNPNRLINVATVKGDAAKFNTNQTFTASAAQTDFVVDYKIVGNVRVTVDGTEKVGGESGIVTTFDYSVNKEQKTVIFETAMSGGESVIVYYDYEIPIKITQRNDASILAYGRFPKTITDSSLKTTNDARLFAKKIVNVYGSPVTSNELRVFWDSSVDVGQTVQVIDSFNSIDASFVVVSSTKTYPEGTKKIKVGVEELDLLNWNKAIDQRIKALEAKQDNASQVQVSLSFTNDINVSIKQGRVKMRTQTIGHSFIIGSTTNGIIGTNTGTQDGQQQVIGNAGRGSMTIVAISNPNNTMIEPFNFTTYKDTGNTTATWNTTLEKCTFTAGQVAQSVAVYKGSTMTSATLTTEDSTNLTAEMSMDGGSHWESVTIGTAHTFTNTGGELLWKLTASGVAETEWVKIVYS